MARPMPCAPPVTSATLPSSRPTIRAYDTTSGPGTASPMIAGRSAAPRALAGQGFDLLGRALHEPAHGRAGPARPVAADGLEDGPVPRQRSAGTAAQAAAGVEAGGQGRIPRRAHLREHIRVTGLQER